MSFVALAGADRFVLSLEQNCHVIQSCDPSVSSQEMFIASFSNTELYSTYSGGSFTSSSGLQYFWSIFCTIVNFPISTILLKVSSFHHIQSRLSPSQTISVIHGLGLPLRLRYHTTRSLFIAGQLLFTSGFP